MPDNQRTVDDVIAEWKTATGWYGGDRNLTPTERLILAEIARLTTIITQQQADLRTLAGAVRVWEPPRRQPGDAVLWWPNWAKGYPMIGTWQSTVVGPTAMQPLPDPPDPTRDAAIAAAVGRAKG